MNIDNRYIDGIILIRDFFEKRNELITCDNNRIPLNGINALIQETRMKLLSIYNKINNTNINELSINDFFKIATNENLYGKNHSDLSQMIREYTLNQISNN